MRDPWRYKLPCGHHNYLKRACVDKDGNDAYNENVHEKMYYCQTCDKYFESKIDKKSGRKVKA